MKVKRVGTLEIGENMRFQVFEWIMERAGWLALAGMVAGMAVGVFGTHPKSQRVVGNQEGPLWVRYDRNPRWQTKTSFEIHALPGEADRKAHLRVNNKFFDRILLHWILPEPESIESTSEQTIFTFAAARPREPMVVWIHYEPQKPGPLTVDIKLNEDAGVSFEQRVYP